MSKGSSIKPVKILANTSGLGGASGDGSVTVLVNTWTQVPSAGNVPVTDYLLIISKETAVGQFRFSFNNGGVPSASNGNKMSSDDLIVELRGDEVIFVGSDQASDIMNFTTKII